MSEEDIQGNFATGIEYLQALELLVKNQNTDFATHAKRIGMLQYLAERLDVLRALEISGLEASNIPPIDEPAE